jgi:hypothetical protein
LLIRSGSEAAGNGDRTSNGRLLCLGLEVCLRGCQMFVRSWFAWESRSIRPQRWGERSDYPCASARHACVGDEVPVVADVEEAKVQTGSRAHTRGNCPKTDHSGQEGAYQGLAFLIGPQHNGQLPNARRHESCPQPCGRGAALNAGRIEGPSPGAESQSPSTRLVGLAALARIIRPTSNARSG